jgi:hypothetical protein
MNDLYIQNIIIVGGCICVLGMSAFTCMCRGYIRGIDMTYPLLDIV